MVLGVPIFKHFRVLFVHDISACSNLSVVPLWLVLSINNDIFPINSF